MDKILGTFAVLIGACSYGLLSTVVKLAYDKHYSLGQITGIQAIVGVLILGCIYLMKVKKVLLYEQSLKEKWLGFMRWFGVGVLAGFVGIFYYASVQYLQASVAIILLFQFVWIGVLIESILEKKWPHFLELSAIALIILGTAFATGLFTEFNDLSHPQHLLPFWGLFFGLLSALFYALFLLANARIQSKMGVLEKSLHSQIGALFAVALFFPPTFLTNFPLLVELLPWGLALGIFGTVLPPILFAYGMPRVGGRIGTILSSVELPMAMGCSALILQEKVSLSQWLGVGLIMTAILLTVHKTSKTQSN